MAKKRLGKPIVFKRDIRFGKEERIKIAQPPDRPTRLRQRDLVRREFIREDPWWWTEHRRGPYRRAVGIDPQEARAVSEERVRGTLPERIMWLALVRLMRFQPDVDFDFQSSLQGGRIELGGMVADFVFYFMKIIIRVQGPTHAEFLRMRKDEEQRMIMEGMGFTVWDADDATIYNVYSLEQWLREHFNMAGGRGIRGGGGEREGQSSGDEELLDPTLMGLITQGLQDATAKVDRIA